VAERFFVDHGMIHDRVTGKHVTTDGVEPFEDGPEKVCALLNELGTPDKAALMWVLCRMEIDSDPDRFGIPFEEYFTMPRRSTEAAKIADEKAFLMEARANHFLHWLKVYRARLPR
jgi:hypothetical protein